MDLEEYVLRNEEISIAVSNRGGEMRSLVSKDGTEYLWQGDPNIWNKRAPNLFPYIAKLTNGNYTFGGETYSLQKHGFLSTSILETEKRAVDEITFCLQDTEETRKSYPFAFAFYLTYQLKGNQVKITMKVQNKDEKTMYFGLGGHPGFRVPLEEGLAFTDYYLEFEKGVTPVQILQTADCFISGEERIYPLEEGKYIPLRHELFDQDAIILKGMGKQVTLKSDQGQRAVRVAFPDMEYLGIWQKAGAEAPYVCIEPWTSLPSRQDVVEAFETQPSLISLPPGAWHQNSWEITIL